MNIKKETINSGDTVVFLCRGNVIKPNEKYDRYNDRLNASNVKEAVVIGYDYIFDLLLIKVKKGASELIGKTYQLSDADAVHFDLVRKSEKEETIVIYSNGQKVIAVDKTTGKKAEAKCNPDDKFDFHVGAKLAFQRLMGDVANEQKKDEICVGDTVKVVNRGRQFPVYETWSGLKGYRQNFVNGSFVNTEDNYKVLVIEKHDTDDSRTVALIQNPKTTQVFIINVKGLKKVER